MVPSITETQNSHSNDTGIIFPRSSNVELNSGFYVPTVAFFIPETEEVDIATTKKHAIRLAEAGVAGLVTHGSNGEAVHLSHDERIAINKVTREALDSINRQDMPLIVGCGAQSTRETTTLCREASASGGQFALVLPPSYYGGLLNTELVLQHFRDVADASPIPIIIYNYPGACSGFDLNSEAIISLSQHENIVGVKLTCGNTGKLARIVAASSAPFLTMGGSADFVLQALVVGGHGIIGGLANVSPKACVQVMKLYEAGKVQEARELQQIVARGDWVAIKGGFVAVKVALQHYYGYGGLPRKPCVLPASTDLEKMNLDFAELMELEQTL
jgi:4-hydroxy-2-oxoglutarate aldolase